LVYYFDDLKNPRFPLIYQVSRYSFFVYSLVLLLIEYRSKHSVSARFGLWLSFLDLCFVSMIDFGGGPGTPYFVYYLFPVITASSRYGVKGSLAVAFCGILMYSVMRFHFADYWSRPIEMDTLVVRFIYLIALSYMFGFLSEFETKQNQRVMALNRTASEAAILDERRRVARELHDHLMQVLATLGLRLEVCRTHLANKPDELVRELELMERAVKDSLVEVRRFLSGKESYELEPGTIVDQLRQDMGFLRDGLGLRLILETDPEDLNIAPEVERQIYLTLREGLLNVARHAQASKATLLLRSAGNELQGSLTDDGIGFNPDEAAAKNTYGLAIMRDRIKNLEGKFLLESKLGEGTKISFTVPVKPSDSSPANDFNNRALVRAS
jgi:signal transduction histidine kinase